MRPDRGLMVLRRCAASSGDGALLACAVRDGLAIARPARAYAPPHHEGWTVSKV